MEQGERSREHGAWSKERKEKKAGENQAF